MKKITLLLVMLITTFSFSQVGINENFDAGTPAGWTDSYANTATSPCAGSSERDNLWGSSTTGNLTSPNQVGASNNTDLTINFDYKIIDYTGGGATAAGWGSADLQYSTNDGATWNTVLTINDGNHIVSATCAAIAPVVIPAASLPMSSDVKLQIANTYTAGDYYFYVDNFSATQVVVTPPNCTILSDPLDAATDVNEDNDLTWTVAAGIPTGYKLTVGTTPAGTDVINNIDVGNVTTYDLGTLAYSTTYYVTVVPYNGNGDATGCSEESFTTRAAPPVGEVCSNPIVVGALPYNTTDDTATYGDDYTGSPGASCTSTNGYLNGDDVVYAYSPVSNTSIDVDLTGIGSTYAGIFIYTDCADIGTTCQNGATNGGATGDLAISDYLVNSGTTYYIVISTWATPQSTTYTLDITENTCTNATATYTVVPDCGNTQFTIDVDITNLGSATSVTISDDQASPTQQASITGIVSFGPYASGTSVNFTVSNDQDGTCVINGNGAYSCPPVNNDCGSPTPLTPGTNFAVNSLVGTIVGSTDSGELATTCSSYGGGDVWYSVVVPADGNITIETNSNGSTITDTAMEVYSGSCGSLVSVECDDDDSLDGNFSLVDLTGRTPGEVLLIRVWEYAGGTEDTFQISAYNATLSIQDLNASVGFKAYPNPVINELTVSANSEIKQLSIVNMLGQTVKTVTPNSRDYKLDFSDLTSGIYFVKALVNNTEGTFRIVKK